MPRRIQHEQSESQERWILSYADFITLLFAFFVVMYALSSINEEKYKALSDSFSNAFSGVALGEGILPEQKVLTNPESALVPSLDVEHESDRVNQPDVFYSELLMKIHDDIDQRFLPYVDIEGATLEVTPLWVSLELPTDRLFQGINIKPTQVAQTAIERLARLIGPYDNPVHIEGFTDNQPLPDNAVFASNWEVSAARSAALVRLFVENGIQPERLAAVGYSEYQPSYSNRTEKGREQNRRVVIVITRDKKAQRAIMSSGVEAVTAENMASLVQNKEKKPMLLIDHTIKTDGGLLFKQATQLTSGEQ